MAGGPIKQKGKGSVKEDAAHHVQAMPIDKSAPEAAQPFRPERRIPSYGDLTSLDTSRLILDSVGIFLLSDIVGELADLLGTSCAVCEKNGDFALRMFAPGWCQYLDQASRRRCGTPDNREALKSGKWLCPESCRNDGALRAIEATASADVACRGGRTIFAVPICAGRETVGSISIGYGDPPCDPATLGELAILYGVGVKDLRRLAKTCEKSPPLLIELAKKRVLSAARIIGEIVARRQAEQTLRRREERFRAMFDLAKDVIFIYDRDGRILEANREACERLGYSRDEFLRMKPFEIDTPEEAALFPERMEALRRQGHHLFETVHQRRDGTAIPAEVSVRLFESAGRQLFLSVCRDITERKRAEAALRASEEKFRSLVETSSDWVWEVDRDGVYTYTSPKVRDLLGYEPEDVLCRTPFDFIAPAERERVGRLFQEALRTQASLNGIENTNIHKNGQPVHLETSAVPIVDTKGDLLGFRGIDRDITARKLAEEKQRESEAMYSAVVQQAKDGVVIIQDDVLQFVNDAMANILGFAPGEMEKTPYSDYLAPESRDMVAARINARLTGENIPKVYEAKLIRKDGTTIDAELSASIIQYRGKPADVGIIRDITDRKRAEEALSRSEALLRKSQTVGRIGSWELDLIVDKLTWSDEVYRIFGLQPQEFNASYEVFLAAVHPDDRDTVNTAYLASVRERGAAYEVEHRIIRRDNGEVRFVLEKCEHHQDAAGAIVRSVGMVQDITERKLVEEALRESEAKFRGIYEASPIGIELYDREGALLDANRACLDIFGISPKTELQRFRLFDDPNLSEELKAQLRRGESVRYEVPFDFGKVRALNLYETTKSGIAYLDLLMTPLKGATESVIGFLVHIRDITERRQIEVQMREVQKLESLGVLAGGIAHDFNNLLMAILGNADLALLSLSPVSPARHYVEEITRASQRAADLCRQMLAYSGKGRFVIDRHDISEIVREMGQILNVSVSKKAMMRYTLAEGLPAVEADATQIRQVIMNLITNASDALGDAGGVIAVTTGAVECDPAYLAESHLGENLSGGFYVTIEVSDTGCGMDAETRNRIFDPFFTTKFAGRGLGLAAVLGIVRGHKGAINVYSEVDKGTTIKILLPAAGREPGRTVKVAEQGASLQAGGTILLVDDDPDVREVAAAMLAKLGFKVLTANNGREGLEVFRSRGAEIVGVILDLTMPEMGGEETFRELRNLRGDVRVIMSSGYNEQEVTQRFVGRGLAGFVQKPYTTANLRSALKRVLG